MGNSLSAPGWTREALAEVTEDCWQRAGVRAGMRVLDAGCGEGISSFLASRMVGAAGCVVGVDRDHAALRRARAAADAGWVANVEFCEEDCAGEAMLGLAPFDAVLGRLYLVQQSDPALEVRKLARLVRTGGIVAFVEPELDYGYRGEAGAPALEQAVNWIQAGYRDAGCQMNLLTSFPRVFLEAGLGWPSVRVYQAPAGWEMLAGTIEELVPLMRRSTRRRMEELGLEAFGERFSVAGQGGVGMAAPLAGAWAQVGKE